MKLGTTQNIRQSQIIYGMVTNGWKEHNSILFRMFKSETGEKRIKQVVVPHKRLNGILKLEHETILSGHMAVKRTNEGVISILLARCHR